MRLIFSGAFDLIVNAAYKLPILELFSSNMLKLSVEFSPAYGTNGRFEKLYDSCPHIWSYKQDVRGPRIHFCSGKYRSCLNSIE